MGLLITQAVDGALKLGSELLLVALCVLLYDSGVRTLLPSTFHQCSLSASCSLQTTCSHPVSIAAFLYPPPCGTWGICSSEEQNQAALQRSACSQAPAACRAQSSTQC